MSAPRSRTTPKRAKMFAAELRKLLQSMPTKEEREEFDVALGALVDYLSLVRESLRNLPVFEDTEQARRALEIVERLIAEAETRPPLAATLGVRTPSVRRPAARVGPEEIRKAQSLLPDLEKLPVEEIRSKLQGSTYTMGELRAVAVQLGIPSAQKLSRDSLAHQITMKIANYRGYRQLSGREAPDSTDSE